MTQAAPIHATAVAHWTPRGWRGLLLRGPSGSGKSDLALRLMARGWRLVADDGCRVWRSGGALYAAAPETIRDRMEVRGVGIVAVGALPLARVVLALDCGSIAAERMPEDDRCVLAGVDLPRLTLDTRPASAVEVAAAAFHRHLGATLPSRRALV